MVRYFFRTIKERELRTVDDFQKGSWVYVEKPTDEELDRLAERFQCDRGLLGDAIDPFEVPRVETEGSVVFVYTRVPLSKGDETTTTPVLVAVGEDFIMTISRNHLPFLEQFTTGETRFSTTQKTKFFLQIFLRLTQTYNSFLTNISRRVRAASASVQAVGNRDIARFVRFESTINDFLSALVPTNALLRNLLSGRYLKLFEEDEDLVEDLLLANGQLVEMAKSTLTNIVNIREAYSTIMANNLNRTIKFLTSLTILLTVPTMIASFYGMNVTLPFADSPNAFWFIAGATLLISALLLGVFSRNKWL